MAMPALPPEECQEILSLFREKLPKVPDVLLQELANQYGKDALIDVDPMDIIEVITGARRIERIEILAAPTETLADVFRRLENACGDVAPQASGAFLAVSGPSVRFREYGELLSHFHHVFNEEVSRLSALYIEPVPCIETRLLLLLALEV